MQKKQKEDLSIRSRIVAVTKVSDKNLTTVPKEVRKKLGIKVGDRIVWVLSSVKEEDGSETFEIQIGPNNQGKDMPIKIRG